MPPENNDQVQYGSDEFTSGAAVLAAKPDLADRLIKWGVAGTREQAQYILIGVIVVCLLITGYFMFGGKGASSNVPPPGALGVPGGAPGAIPQ